MLRQGEVLPNIDVEREVELCNQEKLANADLFAAGGSLGEEEDEENPIGKKGEKDNDEKGEQTSEIRAEVEKRLKRLANKDEEES